MTDQSEAHQRLILDQFTKQAVPFSQMRDHSPELILAASGVGPEDTVLDVACGPASWLAIAPLSPPGPPIGYEQQI
jgi:hypothetical protein